jgi:hypothetical protein
MSICPNELKAVLRRQNWMKEQQSPSRCYAEAIDRAWKFWTQYEQVNRDYCPDDPVYSLTRSGVALSTSADLMDFVASASGQFRILELIIGGEATSSAVNRVQFVRGSATTTTTPTGYSSITATQFNSRSPAAAGSYGSSVTAAVASTNLLVFAFNAFGGFIRWVAAPGEEIYCFGDGTNKEWVGMRSLSGTSTVSSTGIFEEL